MPIRIRRAGPEDASAIAIVHVRAWRAAYGGIVPDTVLAELSPEQRAEDTRSRLQAEGTDERTFVAETEGVVSGFVTAGPSRDPFADPGVGEVYAIYVDPDLWRGGIGSSLLARAVTHLRDRGYTSATLWVLAANEAGRRFYEDLGWEADGSTKPCSAGENELEEVRYRIEL
jgi:ribosomal protein S18 acetylase RimI-like enzyme